MRSVLTEAFLSKRGLNAESLAAVDSPTGESLMRIDDLCEKLIELRNSHSSVAVLPDYDVDGLTAGVVLYSGLGALGIDTRLFVPDPTRGYGFDADDIERLVIECGCPDAIITCDVGVSCVDGVRAALDRGVRVLVTDHHVEDASTSVRELVDVLVNPCAVDESRTLPGICGAHVALLVVERLAKLTDSMETDALRGLRQLAGLATVADVMPMLYENRILVRECAHAVAATVRGESAQVASSERKLNIAVDGFESFIRALHRHGRLDANGDIYHALGWSIIPLLNAARRLGDLDDMRALFSLFTDPSSDADAVVSRLETLDTRRRETVDSIVARLVEGDVEHHNCFVVNAPGGVLGLIASKLCSHRGMPTVVVTPALNGGFCGSMRSPSWYSFIDRTSGLDFTAAGHQHACGVTFESSASLHELDDFITTDAVRPAVSADQAVDVAVGEGCETPVDQRELRLFIEDLDGLKPFGPAFEAPRIAVRLRRGRDCSWRTMGRDGSHLKGAVNGVELVCWGQGADADILACSDTPVSVIGEVSLNRFRGNETVQVTGEAVC